MPFNIDELEEELKKKKRVSVQKKTDDDDKFLIVRCPSAGKKQTIKYFSIELNELNFLGQGSFGQVRLASLIAPDSNGSFTLPPDPDPSNKQFAVKIFDRYKLRQGGALSDSEIEANIAQEALMLGFYYKTEQPVESDSYIYLFTEYIPGSSLETFLQSDEFKTLTFLERLSLLREIMFAFNMVHKPFLKTGRQAHIHADIKPANINVEVMEGNPKKFNVFIIDFGLSLQFSLKESELEPWGASGTPSFMAPEALEDKRGIISDVYALAGIFAYILGASDPLEDKKNRSRSNIPLVPFNLKGLLEGPAQPESNAEWIKNHLILFINRMQFNDPNKRHTSEETLQFITKLYQYDSVLAAQENKEQENILSVQLTLMANGLWKEKVKDEFFFEQFDFEQHAAFYENLFARETGPENKSILISHQLLLFQARQKALLKQGIRHSGFLIGMPLQTKLDAANLAIQAIEQNNIDLIHQCTKGIKAVFDKDETLGKIRSELINILPSKSNLTPTVKQ